MKINLNQCVFLLSSSLLLTACGSGQSNQSQVEEKPIQDNVLYQVYYQAPNISNDITNDFLK
jgi:outer membrane biogenesis lipoprotein LolB